MSKEFTFKGLTFTFPNPPLKNPLQIDGFFEYIDLSNPVGVKQLNFSLSETAERTFAHSDGKEKVDLKNVFAEDYIAAINFFKGTGILKNVVIVGLRFTYRPSKRMLGSHITRSNMHDNLVRYHISLDKVNASVIKKENVAAPVKKPDIGNEAVSETSVNPKKKKKHKPFKVAEEQPIVVQEPVEEKPTGPATPEGLEALVNKFNN